MKLLTVTVPCYNSQDTMTRTLDSLLQGGDRVEIVVIDDGSSDATGGIADAYEEKYPAIVRVIHQENGGHGEGINQGLRHATGRYFKVVDSDDWLSGDFPRFLDHLEDCEKQGGADLVVTNYYYDHADGVNNRSICFKNALPEERLFTWEEVGAFRIDQIMMIHACTFRTALLKERGLELPKHISYEDNMFVYGNLPDVRRMYYLNSDLYHYFIGRAGQSVQQDVLMRNYRKQVTATQLCFATCHLDDIREKRKFRYMKHEMFILFAIAILAARLNRTDEADAEVGKMWEACRSFDRKWADYYRKRTALRFLCIKGKAGRAFVSFIYTAAHKVVRFN